MILFCCCFQSKYTLFCWYSSCSLNAFVILMVKYSVDMYNVLYVGHLVIRYRIFGMFGISFSLFVAFDDVVIRKAIRIVQTYQFKRHK